MSAHARAVFLRKRAMTAATAAASRRGGSSHLDLTCCRTVYSSSSGQQPAAPPSRSSSSFVTRLRALRSNGTPEIVFGIGLLTLLAADQLLQDRQEKQHRYDRETVLRRLQHDVDADTAESQNNSTALSTEEERSRPCLFKCRVRAVPQLFDGTKSLMGVKEGDVVEVLEEQVGPGATYNLCRFVPLEGERGEVSDHVSIGWYPMSCLEKLKA